MGDLVLADTGAGDAGDAGDADLGDEADEKAEDGDESEEEEAACSLPAVRELRTPEEAAAADICDVVLPLPGTEARPPGDSETWRPLARRGARLQEPWFVRGVGTKGVSGAKVAYGL